MEIPWEWPLEHQEYWEMRGWCGVPQGGRLLKQMGMRILWESSLCPPPTPAHMCSACMHVDGQTDTSVCTHTDLWPIRRERAQESQPDPCPAPPQLPALAVTFLSLSLHSSSLLPLLLLSLCFSHSPSWLCWLSANS